MSSPQGPTGWIWSAEHGQYYCYQPDEHGRLTCRWSGAQTDQAAPPQTTQQQSPTAPRTIQYSQWQPAPVNTQTQGEYNPGTTGRQQFQNSPPQSFYTHDPQPITTTAAAAASSYGYPYGYQQGFQPNPGHGSGSLPGASAQLLQPVPQRHIVSGEERTDTERLDPRYRIVRPRDQERFFSPGRAFMMLWTEPAGSIRPGVTRGSTHYSVVRFNEHAYSEIRRFVVVRNMGHYSQCVPIQTYSYQATLKPGVRAGDHAIIYSGEELTPAPGVLFGEELTKQPLRIQPSASSDPLHPCSRINFGKTYTVEHNVKVAGIGKVVREHLVLLEYYWTQTMTGPPSGPTPSSTSSG